MQKEAATAVPPSPSRSYTASPWVAQAVEEKWKEWKHGNSPSLDVTVFLHCTDISKDVGALSHLGRSAFSIGAFVVLIGWHVANLGIYVLLRHYKDVVA